VVPADVEVEIAHLKNYPSAQTFHEPLQEYLEEEVREGRLLKVKKGEGSIPVRVHPIAIIPKSGQPGKYRLITDISSPDGESINQEAPPPPKFRMARILEAFRRLRLGYWMAKVDVAHAFRNVHLEFSYAGHLAFEVAGFYYFELRLPFGFTWSPFIWNSLSDFIQRYCALWGLNLVVYCDDFLIIAKSKKACTKDLNFLLWVLETLNIPVKLSKLVFPTQRIEFLGLILDSTAMTVSASKDRVDATLSTLRSMVSARAIPSKDMLKILGKLTFISQAVFGARTFMRRLYDAATSAGPSVRVTPAVKADLYWWIRFLPKWNGSQIVAPDSVRPSFAFTSDSSSFAAAATTVDQADVWLWHGTPFADSHINLKELWALFHGLRRWSRKFAGANVTVGCDNEVVVAWINSGTARSPEAMVVIRKIFWILARHNIRLAAHWIPSRVNIVADAFSRLDFALAWSLSGISVPISRVENFRISDFARLPPPPPSLPHDFYAHSSLLQGLVVAFRAPSGITYGPLLRDPHNRLTCPHGGFLFGFSEPCPKPPVPYPIEPLPSSQSGSTSPDTPTILLKHISAPSPSYGFSSEYRSAIQSWSAQRWRPSFVEYGGSPPYLEAQNSHCLSRPSLASSTPCLPPSRVLPSKPPSSQASSVCYGPPTWSREAERTAAKVISSDAPTWHSALMARRSAFRAPRQTNLGSAALLPDCPWLKGTRIAPPPLSRPCLLPHPAMVMPPCSHGPEEPGSHTRTF